MFRIAKNAVAALALTGLALSQPAMAVRSSESLPAHSAKVLGQARVGTPVGQTENAAGVPTIGWILALLIAAGVLIIVISDNHNHNKSPG